MKTAQEWIEWRETHEGSGADFIEAIQQDAYRAALLKAAQVCRDLLPHRPSVMSESVTIHRCAKAIEAEAQKGQP